MTFHQLRLGKCDNIWQVYANSPLPHSLNNQFFFILSYYLELKWNVDAINDSNLSVVGFMMTIYMCVFYRFFLVYCNIVCNLLKTMSCRATNENWLYFWVLVQGVLQFWCLVLQATLCIFMQNDYILSVTKWFWQTISDNNWICYLIASRMIIKLLDTCMASQHYLLSLDGAVYEMKQKDHTNLPHSTKITLHQLFLHCLSRLQKLFQWSLQTDIHT